MARIDRSEQPDVQVQQILDILTEYERAHPQARIEGRRQNPVSIRLRIIDPDFQGLDRVEREPKIWQLLRKLPEEVCEHHDAVTADAGGGRIFPREPRI